MKLEGKVAIVTGAGSGFGKASALLFAQEGAQVVVADLSEEAGKQTAEEISAAGGTARFVQVDVSEPSQVKNMIDTAVKAFGTLDVLFNNAGMPQSFTLIEDVPEDFFDKLMAVNVKSIFLAAKYAIPLFKEKKQGAIISTSSMNGFSPRPGLNLYSASKGAVITLTKALAIELAPYNVRANCICPVAGETPMLTKFVGGNDMEKERASMRVRIPLGRLVEPQDVAQAALYLASEDSRMVTGSALQLDGGRGI